MGKIKAALYKFMYGRYGADKLGNFLMIVYVALVLLHTVLSVFIDSILFYVVMSAAALALFIVIIFRMFSKNIAKRRAENQKFCNYFKLRKNKFRDRKTHVYRECPSCHATLRLPKARGMHTVVCPRCKHRFSVKG